MGRQADHMDEHAPRTNAQREYEAAATAALVGDDDNQSPGPDELIKVTGAQPPRAS